MERFLGYYVYYNQATLHKQKIELTYNSNGLYHAKLIFGFYQ